MARVPKTGGAVQGTATTINLPTWAVGILAADCGRLLWLNGFSRFDGTLIYWSSLNGSESNRIRLGPDNYWFGTIALSGRDIFVTDGTSLSKASLMGANSTLARLSSSADHPLAVDEQFVYWGEATSINRIAR
jgi:hypothetical protein